MTENLPHRVVNEVAELEGTDPCSLTPLEEVIDTDCLMPFKESCEHGSVLFVYEGHVVQIYSDGAIEVDQHV